MPYTFAIVDNAGHMVGDFYSELRYAKLGLRHKSWSLSGSEEDNIPPGGKIVMYELVPVEEHKVVVDEEKTRTYPNGNKVYRYKVEEKPKVQEDKITGITFDK